MWQIEELCQTATPIIGMNDWPLFFPCDYWIALDTGVVVNKWYLDEDFRYKDEKKFLKTLSVPKFLRRPTPTAEDFVPSDVAIFFDKHSHLDPDLPMQWSGKLVSAVTTAMAAIHLAAIMAAPNPEVVLLGVDLVGNERIDGSKYPDVGEDWWGRHLETINKVLFLFKESGVKIYKTNKDSPLELPLF